MSAEPNPAWYTPETCSALLARWNPSIGMEFREFIGNTWEEMEPEMHKFLSEFKP